MTEAVKASGAASNAVKRAAGPVRFSADSRKPRRITARGWSVRHSALLEKLYHVFSRTLLAFDRVFRFVGYGRAEKPVAFVERGLKGFLFDCRMCGQCILSSTGMSCPMNCPKQLRNGPCGGVRADGHCEVNPEMPCVWVKAWEGSRNMDEGDAILAIQPPLNQALRETSAWLRLTQEAAASKEAGA